MTFVCVKHGAQSALNKFNMTSNTFYCYTAPSTAVAVTNVYGDFNSVPEMVPVTSTYNAPTAGADGTATMTLPALPTFTYTGSTNVTVRGWYCYDGTSLFWAESFGTAITLTSSADKILITSHVVKAHG